MKKGQIRWPPIPKGEKRSILVKKKGGKRSKKVKKGEKRSKKVKKGGFR